MIIELSASQFGLQNERSQSSRSAGWKQQKATSNGISDDEASISKGSQEDLSLGKWIENLFRWLFEIGQLTRFYSKSLGLYSEKWY